MSKQDLIREAFNKLNDFKRHRALAKIAEFEKNYERQNYHSLKTYELIDALELALRAIQKAEKEEVNK